MSEQPQTYAPDKVMREGGIQHQFDDLERELSALHEAIAVHGKAIEGILRGDDPQASEESLARLADVGMASITSRLRDRTEQVTALRNVVESLTSRLDF